MNRIEEIIARLKAIDARQDEIERECELQHDGQFTDELREEHKNLGAEYEQLKAEKKTLEDDAERCNARRNREEDLRPRQLERRSPENSGSPHPSAQRRSAEQSIESGESDEPHRRRFTIPQSARRFNSLKNFIDRPGDSHEFTAEERAYRFGHYCLAKLSLDIPNRYRFRNSIKFCENYIGDAWNTAHSETDGTTGGEFLVPQEFSGDLIVLRETYGVARRLFAIEPMSTDSKHVPKRASGLTAYFPGENNAGTESNATWSDINLIAQKMMAIARISNELNADAIIQVGDNLAGEIAYAFANKEDNCAFLGDGTSTYGHITGATAKLNSAAGTPTTTSAGGIVIAAGNAYSEILLTDFESVCGTLPQFADTPRTAWVCHKKFYYTVMLKLALAAGGSTAMETMNGDRRPRPLFLGYPVEFSQVMPSTAANSQVCALLGDFTLGAILGDRSMLSIMFSEHATIGGENVFERDQIAIRGTERMDIVVHGVGDTTTASAIVGLQTLNS